ncbi:MAG TPA: VWA domain-containing protein [Vicinamibacterales bacterium]|nr:VWA domain-containing protein [Vicinamibacterales bacterium]
MRDSSSSRLGLSLALAAICWSLLAAQGGPPQNPPPQPQQPTFRTETNYVRVDVYPTRGGAPVHGLKVEDFEVLEDGVRQKIEAFEHVLISPAGPQESRREPSSVGDALQQARNPRSRVFIIFLDAPNVTVTGSYWIKEPIIRLIDRIVGPDDLVGVMTASMNAANITLGRKTEVIEQQLRDNWIWGTRFSVARDKRELSYEECYPPLLGEKASTSALAMALILRKRERATFEALQDLVRWLHSVREERKAIITVTEGWVRYRPDESLMKLREDPNYKEAIPGIDNIGVGPTGKLTTKPDAYGDSDGLSKRECDTDRMRLASMDNESFFLDIVADANRANSSFYPVDPRGLVAFDSPIGPDPPPPPSVDHAILRDRLEAMHDLASATDGMAVVNSNDLDRGLKRIADDLTSYYLLGYYSSNTKLDGKYRNIDVKVKQPGVNVRARRGYRAATAEEVAAARAATDGPAAGGPPRALTAALSSLAKLRPEPRFRVNAATMPIETGTRVWIAGEIPAAPAGAGTDPPQGGTADIEVRSGSASQTARVPVKAGERGFVTSVDLPSAAGSTMQVRARLANDGGGLPVTDMLETEIGPTVMQPLAFRRGPSTGNRLVPVAEFRFSRSDRLRLELPAAAGTKATSARLLDSAGTALQLPVTLGERTDAQSSQRWLTADLTLASLGAGDYAIEITTSSGSNSHQIITAFRVAR